MAIDLSALIEHDMSDDCPACRTLDVVDMALLPAVAAWEMNNGLPRFSLALNGAATLLGVMMEEGVPREDIEKTLGRLLDDIEQQIAENEALGGPTQGSA